MLAVFLTVVMYRAKLLCCSGRLKMESRSRSPDSALRSTLVSWLIACVGNITYGCNAVSSPNGTKLPLDIR